MEIIVSGKFSSDVAESARELVSELQDRLKAIDLSVITAPLDSIVYFPVIVSDELRLPVKSHRSYSRKERAEFVNIEVPHDAWVRGDSRSRRDLLVDGLIQAIEETSEAKLPAAAKRTLTGQITGR